MLPCFAMSPSSAPADPASRRGRVALISLFFVSGAASLVYEAVWNRLLVLQMGNTAYALTTILTVFMGGLALGSVIGGRVASRLRDPLRTYGLLELGIGIYCLLVPKLIEAVSPLMRFVYNDYYSSFATFSFLQFLVCGLVLIVPVTAMGATLPIVTDFVSRRADRVATSVGLAYGINTIGGFAGVMIGGLLLVPTLGLAISNVIAASLSTTAGIVAILFAARFGAPEERAAEDAPEPASGQEAGEAFVPIPLLHLALASSGFAAMVYQVAWTRVITLSIGSVTYSFPLIVGAFIGGLALGAAVLGRLGDRPGFTTPLLVLCQLGIAIFAALTIATLGDLPVRLTVVVMRYSDSFAALQLAKFGAIFAIVFAPTFLMGGMLPLAVRSIAGSGRSGVGEAVGRAYASNTVGTIVGSFFAGFVLIPWLGMQDTIALAVAVNAIVGGMLLLTAERFALPLRAGAAVLAAGLVSWFAFALPEWDRQVITSAPYLHAPLLTPSADASEDEVRAFLDSREADIVYYREDVVTTVTVLDDGRSRYLYAGGKLDALSRSPSQALLGHLPMVLHPKPEKVLVIGLGSSETLASVLRHSSVREVECIEISPAVAEAAGRHFQRDRRPLDDPRLDLRIGDGRVHMAMADERYDVIVSQPGNPWMAGASALFTREYFEQIKQHLAPGGVASVWVQGFSAAPESVNALIGTFASVFDHADLWETRVMGDYILTGYLEPRRFDLEGLGERMREAEVAEGLGRYAVEDAADLLGYLVADTASARSRLPGAGEVNTDDHNFVEIRLQRELLSGRTFDVYLSIDGARVDPRARVARASAADSETLVRRLGRIFDSKSFVRKAHEATKEIERLREAGSTAEANVQERRLRDLRKTIGSLNPRDPLASS